LNCAPDPDVKICALTASIKYIAGWDLNPADGSIDEDEQVAAQPERPMPVPIKNANSRPLDQSIHHASKRD
jgi:hypothetical protein